MKHHMRLDHEPFQKILEGNKTIELRLYDEKRRRVSVGDEIEFSSRSGGTQIISAEVTALHVFVSFDALYKALPLDKCGYTPTELASATAEDMNAYYTVVEQAQYGVVGIEFAVKK